MCSIYILYDKGFKITDSRKSTSQFELAISSSRNTKVWQVDTRLKLCLEYFEAFEQVNESVKGFRVIGQNLWMLYDE